MENEKTEGRRSSLANRGSVRDMIANINKPGCSKLKGKREKPSWHLLTRLFEHLKHLLDIRGLET